MKKTSKSILYLTMIILIICILILIAIVVEKSYYKMKIAEKVKIEQLTQASENNSYVDTTTHSAEVEDAYNKGYTEGYSAGQSNTGTVEYTYHTHGDGYCNLQPVYHAHTSQTGSCYTPIYCTGTLIRQTGADGEEDDDDWSRCNKCGRTSSYKMSGEQCGERKGYNLTCGKTNNTIDEYKCTLTEDTIISATIKYQ